MSLKLEDFTPIVGYHFYQSRKLDEAERERIDLKLKGKYLAVTAGLAGLNYISAVPIIYLAVKGLELLS